MSSGIQQAAPGVYASQRAGALAELADLLVFDMDGVLINVRESFPQAISHAAQQFLVEQGLEGDELAVTPEETALFKAAGGFNSDWALAQAVCLVYLVKARRVPGASLAALRRAPPTLGDLTRQLARLGGGLAALERVLLDPLTPAEAEEVRRRWDRARVSRLCMEYYGGRDCPTIYGIPAETYTGEGFIRRERPLMTAADWPEAVHLGIYTGRSRGEVDQALALLGAAERFPPESVVCEDSGIRKPNPEGLRRLARWFRPRVLIYLGDNLDDWETAARYESERDTGLPPCLFAAVLGGAPGPMAWSLFQERGAELVGDSTAALVAWITGRRALAASPH
jgi:phosphoglycolate phosphatase-like HAD superfamily hydrolase